MNEKFDVHRKIRMPDRVGLDLARKIENFIKRFKIPAFTTAIYLLGSLFFEGAYVVIAEGIYKDTSKETPGPEEIDRFWRAYFPFGMLSFGPIGCAIESMEVICRADKNPVDSFSYEIISSNGYGSTVTAIQQDGACVRVFYRLGVDHGGPEGRICMSPLADLRVKLKLTTLGY